MVMGYSRGHEIYYDGTNWRYVDNNEIENDSRPCKRCGKTPTKEGYDACLGHVDGVTSACCGHGVEYPYSIPTRSKEEIEELRKTGLIGIYKGQNVCLNGCNEINNKRRKSND